MRKRIGLGKLVFAWYKRIKVEIQESKTLCFDVIFQRKHLTI